MADAIRQYEQLLERVMAAKPDIERDVGEAYSLSLLYLDLARLRRAAGVPDAADALAAKTRAMWSCWNQSRPNNPFMLRQLAAVDDRAR